MKSLLLTSHELLRALSDCTDLRIACEHKCTRLQAKTDELLTEAVIARGASAGANAEDPAPSPSGLTRLSAILRSSDTAVRACLAELGPAVDLEQASDEELSRLRTRSWARCARSAIMRHFLRWRASRS